MPLFELLNTVPASDFALTYWPSKLQIEDDLQTLELPKTGKCFLWQNGFISQSKTSPFLLGSSLDILAIEKTNGNYVEAAKLLCESFKHILPEHIASNAEVIGKKAKLHRKLINRFTTLTKRLSDIPGNLHNLMSEKMRSRHKGIMSLLDKAMVDEIHSILFEINPDYSKSWFFPESPCFVIPFFTTPSYLSGYAVVWASGNNRRKRIVWLQDDAWSFAGVPHVTPGYKVELSLSSYLEDMPHDRLCLVEGEGSFTEMPLLDFSKDTSILSIIGFIQSQQTDPSLYKVDGLAIYDYCVDLLQTVILQNKDITLYAPVIRFLPDTIFSKLKLFCREHGLVAAEANLNTLGEKEIVYEDNSSKILRTSSGYVSHPKKGTDNMPQEITNFIITLSKIIKFNEVDPVLVGMLTIKRNSYPIQLTLDDLDSPRSMSKALQLFTITQPEDLEHTPVIIDLRAFNHVLLHYRKNIDKLKTDKGIAFLGWDVNRLAFHTPFGIITKDAVHPVGAIRYNTFITRHFSPVGLSNKPSTPTKEFLDNPVVQYILQAIIHFFHEKPIKPLDVFPEEGIEEKLMNIFSILGQTSLVHLNNNMRGSSDTANVSGFAYLGVGYNKTQIVLSKTPAIILHNSADRIELPDESQWNQLPGLVVKLVQNILQDRGSSISDVQGFVTTFPFSS